MFFLAFWGMIFGSFLTSLTYRAERKISISKGRSFCPKCKSTIAWYDNIPVFSYFHLRGRCRKCKRKISLRYPLIELSTALAFVLTGVFYQNILSNVRWLAALPYSGTIFVLIWVFLFIGIAVTDLEDQIIPDEMVFVGFLVTIVALTTASYDKTFVNLLSGAIAADFLLCLHLFTKGRGMGLGDVKLALLAGTILGPSLTFAWMFLAFILGAAIGIVLLLLKKARLKAHIAFGPFLVASFFIILVVGDKILKVILPL
jgi:prepilin signal peptidase PulO-like enzyme (type II secretory pathway)